VCVAQVCPVCGGTGKRWRDVSPGSSWAGQTYEACNGCGGLGWVTVHCINEPEVRITIDGVPIVAPPSPDVSLMRPLSEDESIRVPLSTSPDAYE